jgi:hypothetical protein
MNHTEFGGGNEGKHCIRCNPNSNSIVMNDSICQITINEFLILVLIRLIKIDVKMHTFSHNLFKLNAISLVMYNLNQII